MPTETSDSDVRGSSPQPSNAGHLRLSHSSTSVNRTLPTVNLGMNPAVIPNTETIRGVFGTSNSPWILSFEKSLRSGCSVLLKLVASSSQGRAFTRGTDMDVRTHWVKSMQPRASLVLGQNCAFFCSVKNAFAATDQFRVGDALYSNKIGDIAPPSSASVIVSEKSGRKPSPLCDFPLVRQNTLPGQRIPR